MPTVTYLSDLHLEFYKKFPFDNVFDWKDGDILCLAGDIGYPELDSYMHFLAYCSARFKYVFIIAGNHEYYKTSTHYLKTILNTNVKIKEICDQFRNVHFLNETSFYIEEYNLNVLGTTLWSDGGSEDDFYHYNDFQKIHNMSLYGYMDKLHEMSVSYLKRELERIKGDGSTVLVLTHHLPSFQLISEKYKNSDMKHLFATNLDHLFRDYTIHHWICGHSHTAVQKTIGTTKIWMNPIGYPGENIDTKWVATFEL